MRRLWSHMRALWPHWTLLPAAPFVVWSLAMLARGPLRWELVGVLLAAPALAYTSGGTKRLLVGVYPVGLVGLLYDAMRYVKHVGVTPARVHTCDLRDLDARIFGVVANGDKTSICDWFINHRSTALDVISAIPYGVFIFAVLGYATFLYVRAPSGLRRFAWAFLFLNVAGFVTYHLYPAAPPWYVHRYGCVANLAAPASAGPALLHVDAMLGVSYFEGFYGRSNDVFGAVPSLHVGYPLLILLEGWARHGRVGRSLTFLFLGTMCFAAVYLDHHWVVDVVLGLAYTTAAYALARRLFPAPARAVHAPRRAGAQKSCPAAKYPPTGRASGDHARSARTTNDLPS